MEGKHGTILRNKRKKRTQLMTSKASQDENVVQDKLWLLATAVRDSCFSAAIAAYENASTDGLCHDGAWECALDAMRIINIEFIITGITHSNSAGI
jgi:hypothetical protein